MTDIVERLRKAARSQNDFVMIGGLEEAADEIERLKDELHSAHMHMNHLRRLRSSNDQ
jgi:hypothetical protein